MSEANEVSFLAEDEYVAFEMANLERHEFIDGVTRAMIGASIEHNTIALNLAFLLRGITNKSGSRVAMEGVRLRVTSKRHYYPDVMATCEEKGDTHVFSRPCLIAEVHSPSTVSIDRGEKRMAYMSMPSLRHLLLIDLEARYVEHTWRTDIDDPWRIELCPAGTTLRLTCPAEAELRIDDILAAE